MCNNLGQCHCDVGYAPPHCDRPGSGGSEHSGPVAELHSQYLLYGVLHCNYLSQALRRVWNLPFSTHSYFLLGLSDTLPVFDAICKRVLSFISKCVNSD